MSIFNIAQTAGLDNKNLSRIKKNYDIYLLLIFESPPFLIFLDKKANLSCESRRVLLRLGQKSWFKNRRQRLSQSRKPCFRPENRWQTLWILANLPPVLIIILHFFISRCFLLLKNIFLLLKLVLY